MQLGGSGASNLWLSDERIAIFASSAPGRRRSPRKSLIAACKPSALPDKNSVTQMNGNDPTQAGIVSPWADNHIQK